MNSGNYQFFLLLNAARNITTEVQIITTITNHRSVSNGSDFTISAAINTDNNGTAIIIMK